MIGVIYMTGFNCLKGTERLWEGSLLFTTMFQKFLVLIRSTSEGWKTVMILKPSSRLELVYQLVITKYKLKSQNIKTDSIMTLNCELCQSEFSVLSGRLIKNTFPLYICRPNDYTIEIIVLLQIQLYNIFTNVLFIIFKGFH